MKKANNLRLTAKLTLAIILIYSFTVFNINFSTVTVSNTDFITKSYFKEKILIVLVNDINLNNSIFQSKGIYSLLHAQPNKNYKDLFVDIQKSYPNLTSMTREEYASRGHLSNSSIILIKDMAPLKLKDFLLHKPIDTTLILTSLSNSLNPLWISGPENGLIYSNATRRQGFIKYTDFLSLIVNRNSSLYNIHFIKHQYPISVLRSIYNKNLSLLYSRYILIGFIFLGFLFFLQLKKYRSFFSYFIFLCPILSSILSFSPYSNLDGLFKSILIISISLITSGLLYYFDFNYNRVLLFLWLSTLLFLIYFTFSRSFLYESPIGFNNIFYGTRFYGWNNDLIGFFLGPLLSIFFIVQKSNKNEFLTILLSLLCIYTLCFSPLYGANVGGMLSCFFTIIISVIIFEKLFSRKLLYIGTTFTIFILLQNLFINWDIQQTSSTHWGSWIQSVQNKEFSFSLSVIYTKLKQVIRFLLIPPLNLFLFLQWGILWNLRNLDLYCKKWRTLFFIISLIVILLNDSGVLSSTFMLIYFIISIDMMNNIKNNSIQTI